MKIIAVLSLLIICIQALNISKLKIVNSNIPEVYPKYTGDVWDEIKRNQTIHPVKNPGSKPGDKPQPASAGFTKFKSSSRIIGGMLARQGQFPWQAFLSIDNSVVCGGSLISNIWILTAAHCTAGHSNFIVLLGAQYLPNDNEPGRQIFRTAYKIVHKQFNPNNFENDISLLQLPGYASITEYVGIIRLPSFSEGSIDLTGYYVTISGWGKISDNNPSINDQLKYVQMPVMSNINCAYVFGSMITNSKLCTNTEGRRSPCNGDSGGPLIIQETDGGFTEVGIVSFGSTSGCELGYPAVFTRVTSFLNWIQTFTGIAIRP